MSYVQTLFYGSSPKVGFLNPEKNTTVSRTEMTYNSNASSSCVFVWLVYGSLYGSALLLFRSGDFDECRSWSQLSSIKEGGGNEDNIERKRTKK